MSQPTFHGWDFNVFGVATHQSFYRIIFAGITCDPQTSKKEIISICLTENCSILSLSKASFRLYILRVCKHYRFLIDYLDLHFQSLILSIFTYAIEVCGGAFYNKYLSRIDKFVNKVFKLGYTKECYSVLNVYLKRTASFGRKLRLLTIHFITSYRQLGIEF